MSETRSLSACFETLYDETLPSLGIDDPSIVRIVTARLLIERLGERDANYWWDSQVLSEFGRDTLEETVPRTGTRSQIELAMKVGRKVERENLPDQAISLFDLGPFVESQIQRELEELEAKGGLTVLEDYSIELAETGWANSLTDGDFTSNPSTGETYEVGSLKMDDLQAEEVLEDVVSQLIHGYGASTRDNITIPYYSIKQ